VPDLGEEIEGELSSVKLTEAEVVGADCVVVLTAHSAFDWQWIAERAALVVDTRNALVGCEGKARVIGL
jgi:UDP-N-acetyl-D-glucosamine dehydrogenase